MSKTTKRKHVTKEVVEEFVLPEKGRQIVKVVSSRGNNLHEVVYSNGESFLASMPTKFRKNVWIKRGDFVMVDPIEEGDKVKAEISHILYKEQIKYIQQEGLWPPKFEATPKNDDCKNSFIPADMLPPSDEDSEDDNLDSIGGLQSYRNPNRIVQICTDSDESSDESS